jgi:hypothetical protein
VRSLGSIEIPPRSDISKEFVRQDLKDFPDQDEDRSKAFGDASRAEIS